MRSVLSTLVLLCLCNLAAAADEQPADAFPLRSHNPFLQIFGLPAFQTAALGSDINLSYDITNDADDKIRTDETLIIDGESQVVALALRRQIGERFELRLDVPWVHHSGGFLDDAIKDWHSVLGLSNSARAGPENRLQHLYEVDGTTLYSLTSSTSGIGDVQVSTAYALPSVTLRAGVKLPTGDPDKLTGSGAADLSLGAYLSRRTLLFDRELGYSGFVGVLLLGDGKVLPDQQRNTVPYAGLALRWQVSQRLALGTQWYLQGSYYDISIDEIGGSTMQLGVGADYRLERSLLRLAIAEDIAAGAAPDFALHLSIQFFND